MSVIFCPINLFDMYQIVYLIKNNNQEILTRVALANADEVLTKICYNEEVYNIHLLGVDGIVINLADKIKKYENLKFSQDKIKVEVTKNETFD